MDDQTQREQKVMGSLWLHAAVVVVTVFGMLGPRQVMAAEPAPATQEQPEHPPGHRMVIAGSVMIFGSAAGYIAMAVGLGMGTKADADVRSLTSANELERRRDVMARGELGNRLAIGAGISAAVLMASGITLVVVGRRRATNAPALSLLSLRRGAGVQLRVRF